MNISLDKKYKTTGLYKNLPVKLFILDGGGAYPIKGVYKDRSGVWLSGGWAADGTGLIEVKERQTKERQTKVMFTNIYQTYIGGSHDTREAADKSGGHDRIACVPVTISWEEGEGL